MSQQRQLHKFGGSSLADPECYPVSYTHLTLPTSG